MGLQSKALIAWFAFAGSCGVLANPIGPQVASGVVRFDRPDPATLNITNTPGAIINWKEFSIGASEVTRFIQQNSVSAVLNRVGGANPSQILGQLTSNGRVFLINRNGIVFGAGAHVDTAGFVASTLSLSDVDFLAGRLRFEGTAAAGSITNHGFIKTAPGGEVVLIAPSITNAGTLQADRGQLILAAGQKVTLSSLDLDHISFEVQAADHTALNVGKLIAEQGMIGVFAGQIDQRGEIEANKVTRDAGGVIRLVAQSTVDVAGNVSATGAPSVSGGAVEILGSGVVVRDARIDVSGGAGGGTVLVGGAFQGRGSTPTARTTAVAHTATIHADATQSGNGGQIIVWADRAAQAHGRFTARGGPAGGDGGLIETSGKVALDFSQAADVSAPRGRPGTWLLDPENIDIGSGKAAAIEKTLNQGGNVSVVTGDSGPGEGNITVRAPITKTDGGDATLSMRAHNRIDVNAPIGSTHNALNVKLKAGTAVNVNSSINTNGGSLSTQVTGVTPGGSVTKETTAIEPVAADQVGEPEPEAAESVAPDDDVADTQVGGEGARNKSAGNDKDTIAGSDSPSPAPAADAAPQRTVEPAASSEDPPMEPTDTTADASTEVAAALASDQVVDQTVTAAQHRSQELQSTSGHQPTIRIVEPLATSGGEVRIDAGTQGTVSVHADVDASNTARGEVGGDIALLGKEVGVYESAVIDASGDAGGGAITIGSDLQPGSPAAPEGAAYVGPDATVRADAITSGDGGSVVVRAARSTKVSGRLSARGGAESGDGGVVVTSGAALQVKRAPDVGAPAGDGGAWTIRSADVTLVAQTPAAVNLNFEATTSAQGGWDTTDRDPLIVNQRTGDLGSFPSIAYRFSDGDLVRVLTATAAAEALDENLFVHLDNRPAGAGMGVCKDGNACGGDDSVNPGEVLSWSFDGPVELGTVTLRDGGHGVFAGNFQFQVNDQTAWLNSSDFTSDNSGEFDLSSLGSITHIRIRPDGSDQSGDGSFYVNRISESHAPFEVGRSGTELGWDLIAGALRPGVTVTIAAGGDSGYGNVTVKDELVYAPNLVGNTLAFVADNDIALHSSIRAANSQKDSAGLNLSFVSDRDGDGHGATRLQTDDPHRDVIADAGQGNLAVSGGGLEILSATNRVGMQTRGNMEIDVTGAVRVVNDSTESRGGQARPYASFLSRLAGGAADRPQIIIADRLVIQAGAGDSRIEDRTGLGQRVAINNTAGHDIGLLVAAIGSGHAALIGGPQRIDVANGSLQVGAPTAQGVSSIAADADSQITVAEQMRIIGGAAPNARSVVSAAGALRATLGGDLVLSGGGATGADALMAGRIAGDAGNTVVVETGGRVILTAGAGSALIEDQGGLGRIEIICGLCTPADFQQFMLPENPPPGSAGVFAEDVFVNGIRLGQLPPSAEPPLLPAGVIAAPVTAPVVPVIAEPVVDDDAPIKPGGVENAILSLNQQVDSRERRRREEEADEEDAQLCR